MTVNQVILMTNNKTTHQHDNKTTQTRNNNEQKLQSTNHKQQECTLLILFTTHTNTKFAEYSRIQRENHSNRTRELNEKKQLTERGHQVLVVQ